MKIKFNSDEELPLNKTIEISSMTIVVRTIFLENNKYPQVFLDYIRMESIEELKKNKIKSCTSLLC